MYMCLPENTIEQTALFSTDSDLCSGTYSQGCSHRDNLQLSLWLISHGVFPSDPGQTQPGTIKPGVRFRGNKN